MKKLLSLLLALAMLLSLVACSKNDPEPASAGDDKPATVETPAEEGYVEEKAPSNSLNASQPHPCRHRHAGADSADR